MVSAGLGVEWMEGGACFDALTGVNSGGDLIMVAIDLDSTGLVLDDVPTACISWLVGSNDGEVAIEEEPSAKEELFSSGKDTKLPPN